MNIKSILKKTREAIDSKNFTAALQLSRQILDEDNNNYMALVYAGLASQETGSNIDSEKYYKKAIQLLPTNILAWQGLVNYYDKLLCISECNPVLVKKLLDTYVKLIEFDGIDEKVYKILSKIDRPNLVNVAFNEVIDTLEIFLMLDAISKEAKQKIQRLILKLLADNRVPEKYESLFEKCYLSENEEDVTEAEHLVFLKLQYTRGQYEILLQYLKALSQNLTIAHWQCEIFIDLYILQDAHYTIFLEHFKLIQDELDNLDTLYFSLVKIILDILNGLLATVETKDALKAVVSKNSSFLQAWIILAECYVALQFDQEAIDAIVIARNLHALRPNSKYQLKIDLLVCYSFCSSDKVDELKEAKQIAEKKVAEGCLESKLLVSLIKLHIKLKNTASAKNVLELLDNSSDSFHYMTAFILQQEGKDEDAIKELEENVQSSSEYWLLLGDLYWTTQMSKSLVAYLKATKQSPSLFICYERLGQYYQKTGELEKSRRCYEKSFKIKTSKAACIELSRIYRKLHKWDENQSLLLTLMSGNITSDNAWAYFQLGIHYYEREDFTRALTTLRLVIRVERTNSFCWECLGDCYFSGGAYTSALKCYQKSKEIDTTSLYPMLQIANIRKLLGEYLDAEHEFEALLELDSNYIPALKGIAETCYLIAKQYYRRQLYGLARDALQSSLNYISRALRIKSSLSCCWKIAADCFYTASLLPFNYAFLSVSYIISDSKLQDPTPIYDELLAYAIHLYYKALSLNPTNVNISHDLACSYLRSALLATDAQVRENMLKQALTMTQHCIVSDADCAEHWNVLGSVFFHSATHPLGLAQHAFVKAVTSERNSARSWTNLGALYLHVGELKLANDAFSQAQKSNPNYVQSWIGQALIAEASGVDEAMDLFRHTMELAYHPEGTVGYAHWVCRTLMTKRRDEVIYEIDNMHAIAVACDGLRWYVENNPRDACGWNMFGILSERLGLLQSAGEAYEKAAKYSERAEALTNLGRTLHAHQEFAAAIGCYERIAERTPNAEIGYALALFKAERYEQAYSAYEAALNGDLASRRPIQSDLLVALASMNYMFGGPDPTKHLLFQSIELATRSPWSLYAVLALGLLHDDTNLATLALDEIRKHNVDTNEEDDRRHFANLLTYTFLVQGNFRAAIVELSTLIHRHPDSASLWFALSALLYRTRDAKSMMDKVIVKCAQASLRLKDGNPNLGRSQVQKHVLQVLPMVTATSILAGDLRNAVKTAQRQVHYYPNDDTTYQVLRISVLTLVALATA